MKIEKYYRAIFRSRTDEGGYIEHFHQENMPTESELYERSKKLEAAIGRPIRHIEVDNKIYYTILPE